MEDNERTGEIIWKIMREQGGHLIDIKNKVHFTK